MQTPNSTRKRTCAPASRASARRTSPVLVQLLVAGALLLDIGADGPLVAQPADGAGEIAVAPELPTPKLFLHAGAPPEDLPRGEALDDHHQLGHAVGRHRLHQEVHMIPVRADLEKLELIAGLKLQAHFPQHLVDQAIDHHPPILGREHQVVEQHRDVVTLVDIAAHPQPLRRKRRGMQPRAIQDDAFISFRYADNLARGNGLVWNLGEYVEGYTNFLWTILIAVGPVLALGPYNFFA